ncbi:MAG TPA: outer membrane lipid asymmetry maintenance protein MlaD [Rhizomicrobium sp.]|jgi:phospholipid/cholesterol/gamma-HCH transport system substrate-binding protein|nr:outer membrane lipid asymmetry maintenance protein MlaD [Rhizomicrobium sp.]
MSAKGVKQSNVTETLIGAVVVIVALGFLALTYLRTGTGSLSGYEVLARLPKVDGLGVGTDVRISGIKVGSVSDMVLDPKNYLVTVHMNIRSDIKLPTDSSMMITSSGILGSSYLSIAPGGDETDIKPGGYIENTQAANSADLMSLAGRFIGGDSGKPAIPKPAPAKPQDLGAGP